MSAVFWHVSRFGIPHGSHLQRWLTPEPLMRRTPGQSHVDWVDQFASSLRGKRMRAGWHDAVLDCIHAGFNGN
jgi:hypothetical protein